VRVLGPESRRDEAEQVLADLGFVPALGRDVDELERPRGEAVGERGHDREPRGSMWDWRSGAVSSAPSAPREFFASSLQYLGIIRP
jgi:hypothetical protein